MLSYCKTETHLFIEVDCSLCLTDGATSSTNQSTHVSLKALSVLGPLLFIIYIDGLTNALSNSSMSLCADDILFRTTQSPSDYQILQAETDALSDCI